MNMSSQWELTERRLAAAEASSTGSVRPPAADAKKKDEATPTGRSGQQPIVRTCGICGESTEGTVVATAAWFADHRRAAHPELPALVATTRRKRGFGFVT